MHLQGHFDLLTFDLVIMTFTLKILSGSLLSLETTWELLHLFRTHQLNKGPLLYVGSFRHFEFRPWNYDPHLENIAWVFVQNSCMAKASMFSWQINITNACAPYEYVDILKSDLDTMTFTKTMLSLSLLWKYKWQQFHILWVYHPNMGPVHCEVILAFWPLTLI